MRDRAEVGLVGVERGWSAAAVADELLVAVDRAHGHDARVAVRAPDALAGPVVGATAPIGTGVAAVARGKQHQNAFVDGLHDLASERVVRVGRVIGRPVLLEHAPAVGQHMRRAVGPVPVDRPLESGQGSRHRGVVARLTRDAQIVELRVRRHAQDIGAAHHSVVAPGRCRGPPIGHRKTTDHATQRRLARFGRLDGSPGGTDASIHHADHDALATLARAPDRVDAQIGRHLCNRPLGCGIIAIAGADRASRHPLEELRQRCLRPLRASVGDAYLRVVEYGTEGLDPAVGPDLQNVGVSFQLVDSARIDEGPDDDGFIFRCSILGSSAPDPGQGGRRFHRYGVVGRIDAQAGQRGCGAEGRPGTRSDSQFDQHAPALPACIHTFARVHRAARHLAVGGRFVMGLRHPLG